MQAVEAILQQYADAETQDAAESEPGDCIEDVPAREVEMEQSDIEFQDVGIVNSAPSCHSEKETESASAANVSSSVASTQTDFQPEMCNCCRHCHPPHSSFDHSTVQPHTPGPRSSTPAFTCTPTTFLPPSSVVVDETMVHSHLNTQSEPLSTSIRTMSFPPVTFFPCSNGAVTENDLTTSFVSMSMEESQASDDHDSADPSFIVGIDSTTSTCSISDEADDQQEPADPVSDRKFIVFEGQLNKLLTHCPDCGAPVEETDRTIKGSLLSVKMQCLNGHDVTWDSQPTIGRGMVKTGYGNLLMAAAILFSGGLYSTFSLWASLLNLAFFGKTTFYKIQREILCPVINLAWSLQVEAMHFLCRGEQMKVIGDARCDSPGYSAKYGKLCEKTCLLLVTVFFLKSSCATECFMAVLNGLKKHEV